MRITNIRKPAATHKRFKDMNIGEAGRITNSPYKDVTVIKVGCELIVGFIDNAQSIEPIFWDGEITENILLVEVFPEGTILEITT